MATLNIGMKVNRAIGGATTVNANSYAMVTYTASGTPSTNPPNSAYMFSMPPITRHFGPGQSIPSSFTTPLYSWNGVAWTISNLTYSLSSGVEIINTI